MGRGPTGSKAVRPEGNMARNLEIKNSRRLDGFIGLKVKRLVDNMATRLEG
jgi:hypothetical protein